MAAQLEHQSPIVDRAPDRAWPSLAARAYCSRHIFHEKPLRSLSAAQYVENVDSPMSFQQARCSDCLSYTYILWTGSSSVLACNQFWGYTLLIYMLYFSHNKPDPYRCEVAVIFFPFFCVSFSRWYSRQSMWWPPWLGTTTCKLVALSSALCIQWARWVS